MRAADHILDIGPLAGSHGGELVFSGSISEILKDGCPVENSKAYISATLRRGPLGLIEVLRYVDLPKKTNFFFLF